jgi:hypothetical protein
MLSYVRLISSAALVVGGVLCGLALSRPLIGQDIKTPPAPEPQPRAEPPAHVRQPRAEPQAAIVEPGAALDCKGRFQAVGTGGLAYTIVIDTVTGRCWALYPSARDDEEDTNDPSAITTEQNAAASGQRAHASGQDATESDEPKRWVPLGKPPGAGS